LASHRSSAAESSLPAPFSVRVSALVSVVVFVGEMKETDAPSSVDSRSQDSICSEGLPSSSTQAMT
jgi:hypothetical protein